MRIWDWSSDVCFSDLVRVLRLLVAVLRLSKHSIQAWLDRPPQQVQAEQHERTDDRRDAARCCGGVHDLFQVHVSKLGAVTQSVGPGRSAEHTTEIQSLMGIAYTVFVSKKKITA